MLCLLFLQVQMNNPHDVKAAKETRSNQCLRCLNGEPVLFLSFVSDFFIFFIES